MDPATLIMATASAAKGVGSIMSGYSRASEMKQEAANYEMRASQLGIQRNQDSANLYTELDSAMQTIAALRGARNVGFNSPTAVAVDKAVQKQARAGILSSQAGYIAKQDSARRSAKSLRRGSRMAVAGGWLNSVPSFFDAYGAFNAPK